MESGPSRMYQSQTAAFLARRSLVTDLGPSTVDTPPVFNPPDIDGLKALKKQVVENLPKTCVHCGAELFPECFLERIDGSIMQYCKKKGACGRSLVLFAGVEMTKPVYRKICPFEKVNNQPPVQGDIFLPTRQQDTSVNSMQIEEPRQQQQFDMIELMREVDVYALHGIQRPTDVCGLCGLTYDVHEHKPCDQYGWVHDHDERLPLPDDWLIFDPTSHTWLEISSLR